MPERTPNDRERDHRFALVDSLVKEGTRAILQLAHAHGIQSHVGLAVAVVFGEELASTIGPDDRLPSVQLHALAAAVCHDAQQVLEERARPKGTTP